MGFLDSISDKLNPFDPGGLLHDNKNQGNRAPASSGGSGLPYWFTYGDKNTQYPGIDSLMNLLKNPGQTDTLMLNRALSANARGTQSAQTAAQGNLARSGYGGAGLGQALQAAIGQAGQNRQSGIYADEARRREDLLRSDLSDLLYRFTVGPEVTTYGANKGVSVAQDQAKKQSTGAAIGAGAGLLAALIPLFACRTAEELYGVDAEETAYARFYMGVMADPETREKYGTGAELAERVRRDPALRAKVKPIFDTFVEEARSALRAA